MVDERIGHQDTQGLVPRHKDRHCRTRRCRISPHIWVGLIICLKTCVFLLRINSASFRNSLRGVLAEQYPEALREEIDPYRLSESDSEEGDKSVIGWPTAEQRARSSDRAMLNGLALQLNIQRPGNIVCSLLRKYNREILLFASAFLCGCRAMVRSDRR